MVWDQGVGTRMVWDQGVETRIVLDKGVGNRIVWELENSVPLPHTPLPLF